MNGEAEVAGRYFAGCCFFLASARRSFFFRRFARFLALSLPLLCPIRTQPWPTCRDVAIGRNRGRRLRPPEADCVRCGVGAGASGTLISNVRKSGARSITRSEEHTSELQSQFH